MELQLRKESKSLPCLESAKAPRYALGDFEVLGLLGRGAFGTVQRVQREKQVFAMKVIETLTEKHAKR